MTLDQMITTTLRFAQLKSNADTKTEITSALNYAYKKICREKYRLKNTEDVTLIVDGKFDCKSLAKSFFIPSDLYIKTDGDYILLPSNKAGDTVTINYYYIPTDLVNPSDVPELPETIVDHKILCFYAAYESLKVDGDEEGFAPTWLNLFNDGFNNIKTNRQPVNTVQNVDGGYWYDN
jgi:hypothetical protein